MSLLVGAGQFGLAELAQEANDDRNAVERVMNNIGIFSPGSMNSLRSQPGLTGTRVEVLGYTRSGDGGGGLFYWDANSTETDDGATIIAADGVATGRYKRINRWQITPQEFGAKADGVTDDTLAIQRTLNAAGFNQRVYLPTGTYKVSSTLRMPDWGKLLASPGAVLSVAGNYAKVIEGGNDMTYVLRPGKGCRVEDLTININGFEPGGIMLFGVTGTKVLNCTVKNWSKGTRLDSTGEHFGIGLISSTYCWVLDCTTTNGEHGIHAYNCDYSIIAHNQGDVLNSGVYTAWTNRCLVANNVYKNTRDVVYDIEGGTYTYIIGNHAERGNKGEYTLFSGGGDFAYTSHHLIVQGNTAHRLPTYVTSYKADGSENVSACDAAIGALHISSLGPGQYESGFVENIVTVDYGRGITSNACNRSGTQIFFRSNRITSTTGQFLRLLDSDNFTLEGNYFHGKAAVENGENEIKNANNLRLLDNTFVYETTKTGDENTKSGFVISFFTDSDYVQKRPLAAYNKFINTGDWAMKVDFFKNTLSATLDSNQLTQTYTARGGLYVTDNGGPVVLRNQRLKLLFNPGVGNTAYDLSIIPAIKRAGIIKANGTLGFGRVGFNGLLAHVYLVKGSGNLNVVSETKIPAPDLAVTSANNNTLTFSAIADRVGDGIMGVLDLEFNDYY